MMNSMMFNGKKVFVTPDFYTYSRTWKERLWSWPWRPFTKTKQVPNTLYKDGEFIITPQAMYCNQKTFNELKLNVPQSPKIGEKK